jgi:hypothetical protein
MAKPNNSGWILTALLLIPIFYLLKYMASEAVRVIPMHEYLMLAIIIIYGAQVVYFWSKSTSKLRKQRKGEVHYRLYTPPLFISMGISVALGLICAIHVLLFNTNSPSIGYYLVFFTFFGYPLVLVFYIMKYRSAYIKITDEEFFCYRKGKELKILFSEVEWVDYMTKIMDVRRGWEKIGIVFKLQDGREQEVYTWKWGFTQGNVTELMQDIGAKMAR